MKGRTGNNHVTITDRKLQIDSNGGKYNGYKAYVDFKAEDYIFSSASNYAGEKGLLEILVEK